MIRGLMSDEEWACLEPFVIERGARSGCPPRDHRLVLDGIFWIARTGVAWRDLHEHFGKWSSVLPPVPALDAVGVMGVAARSVQRQRRRQPQLADDRQHNNPGAPLFSRR